MLAGQGRDDLERCRADRVDEEKEGSKEETTIGAGPAEVAWDYPEGGRGWWVVLVSNFNLLLLPVPVKSDLDQSTRGEAFFRSREADLVFLG